MKFTRLILDNYIGIYNGMGLNHIDLNLSLCRHKMLIIRGENGSGKSTIFNAMSVMPDSNDLFIPDKSASKIIELQDGNTFYRMSFIHPIKANGTRDTTKAYLSKFINGGFVELNPNGNVTSYKEILYEELGLDPNFIALSQLSTEDRGLANKRPAERKRFVNSIMSSLEVYNNIYKSLSKRSSSIKSMINSSMAKLGRLGDINILSANLVSIENQINHFNDLKDKSTKDLMKYTSQKELIDPDGNIQSRHSTLSASLASKFKRLNSIYTKLNITVLHPLSAFEYYTDELNKLISKKNVLESDKRIATDLYNNLTESIMDLNRQEEQKKQSLEMLSDEESFETICDMIAESEAILAELTKEISASGVNPDSFTKEEYITALNTLKDIKEAVLSFRKVCSSTDDMMEVIELAKAYDRIPIRDASEYQKVIDRYIDEVPRLNEFIISCDNNIEKLKLLSNRPSNCLIDNCPFISDLIALRDSNIVGQRAEAAKRLSELEILYENAKLQISRIENFNLNAMHLNNLIRMVTISSSILIKLPFGSIYSDKIAFIEALINNQDFSYIDKIYGYINLANKFDEYNVEKRSHDDLIKRRDLYLSKSDVIGSLNSELEEIKAKKDSNTTKQKNLLERLNSLEDAITQTEDSINIYKNICSSLSECVELSKDIQSFKSEMNSLVKQMSQISNCDEMINKASSEIISYSKSLEPLYKERDKIQYSINMINEYNKELEVIQNEYNLIETIRYYSSPTSGIQLVFMELYMGKIIGLANELLSLLFKGKFVIQPFIINESEFRIPCLGDGYINDDISSMSSAQISMISMILGFALLHYSSTKYNILKLDEIDGPLDENNRILFIDLLNKIMDIMKTEQCILISHNSEINVDDADVIILKHDNLSTDFTRGNIIWKY